MQHDLCSVARKRPGRFTHSFLPSLSLFFLRKSHLSSQFYFPEFLIIPHFGKHVSFMLRRVCACACAIASEVRLFFPSSPAPVNICRRHLLHCEQICSSVHRQFKNQTVCVIQSCYNCFHHLFFLNRFYSPHLVAFMDVSSCSICVKDGCTG